MLDKTGCLWYIMFSNKFPFGFTTKFPGKTCDFLFLPVLYRYFLNKEGGCVNSIRGDIKFKQYLKVYKRFTDNGQHK